MMRSTPEPGDQTAEGSPPADAVSNVVDRADLRLELHWESHDVTGDFFRELVNRQLRTYKTIIQWGGKAGQSYFGHVLDLVLLFERLNALVSLSDAERRCLYCACVVHDLNKVPPYNRWTGGRHTYADQASEANILAELGRLEAERFFPIWRDYLADIVALAHLHQGNLAITATGLDRTQHRRFKLGWERVEHLGWLMYAMDALATSHTLAETRSKANALDQINRFLAGRPQRWLTHRVAEQRGLLTNLIHNAAVAQLRDAAHAVDLLYYPDGVAYLVPRDSPFMWNADHTASVAARVRHRLVGLQQEDVGKFIRNAPWGIAVDSAALESGTLSADIFGVIFSRVQAKPYKADWLAQRTADITTDLQVALSKGKLDAASRAYVVERLATGTIIPVEPEMLRRGELVMAYRNYLNAHATTLLKAAKVRNGDTRVYTLLRLPKERWLAYGAVNTYRWGYFLAADCVLSLDDLHDAILADLAQLQAENDDAVPAEHRTGDLPALDSYLGEALAVAGTAVPATRYAAHLSRYVKGEHRQCCLCSGAAPTQEWMAANAPLSIGVQLFSNRLEGGDSREPKRNICPVCRTQFILERLAWKSHRDRQGAEQTTFYLHLFPYSFFTRSMLTAWFAEVQRLRSQGLGSFFIKADAVFRDWVAGDSIAIQGVPGGTMGVALPELAEALGNTPILPIHARGQGYGEQFLQALETAAVLARFFGCRALLSRLPVPLLDLSTMPDVALCVEGMPRNLGWLLSGTADGAPGAGSTLNAAALQGLFERLGHLHALKQRLWFAGFSGDMVHELATAMNDDALGIYAATDRLLEKKVAKGGRGSPEWQMIHHTHDIAPYLQALATAQLNHAPAKKGR